MTADEIIAGHRQIITRAHARGLKIFGATLTPFEGALYFTPEGEANRQAVAKLLAEAPLQEVEITLTSLKVAIPQFLQRLTRLLPRASQS